MKLSNLKMLVIGDIIIDHYQFGEVSKISPEAPTPIINLKSSEYKPGGASNLAINLASIGASVTLIGVVNSKKHIGLINKHLANKKINLKIIIDSKYTTPFKTRFIANGYQLLRLDEEEVLTNKKFSYNRKIINYANKWINQNKDNNTSAAVLFSDYQKGSLIDPKKIIEKCKEKKIITFLDSKSKDLNRYKGVEIFKPNNHEFNSLFNNSNQTDASKFKYLQSKFKFKTIFRTLGEEGIELYSKNKLKKIKTKSINVLDVTGAGDTCLALISVAKLLNFSDYDCAMIANKGCALVIDKIGTASVTKDNFLNILDEFKKK